MRSINLTAYLDETAARMPNAAAITQNERELSFAELRNLALRLAHEISAALNGRKRQIVAVFLPKGLEAAVANLAILYSGNAYMNLDVHSPRSRLELIAGKTQPTLLLAAEAASIGNVPALPVDLESLPHLDESSFEQTLRLRDDLIDTDLLCLINTSGSTGVPKAVALCHRGFIDFVEAVRETGLVREDEVIGSLSPVIFDIWSFELCMVMAYGSRLVCLPENEAAFPPRLLERLRICHVSFIFWVPTIMVVIANSRLLDEIQLPDLRMIWFAGEVFPTIKFNYWRKKLPQATFANFYGPIEITLDCLYFIADRPLSDDEAIPIGRPFPNTRVILLDENNRQITADNLSEEGEICVTGSSLACGYYNDAEKTALAFTQNPLQNAYPEIIYRTGDIGRWNSRGELMFAGRKDSLIKHRGYRIELGEVEHLALNAQCGITNCCAIYDGEKIILIYEAPEALGEKTLLRKLLEYMPRYMAPRAFWHFKELPRNPNGKIDRNYLKEAWKAKNGTN